MKIHRVVEGQYSEIKLDDGTKVFISVLPDRITMSKMVLFLPTQKIWEFIFPFYIRTAKEPWDSSKDILRITIETIESAKKVEELLDLLKNQTNSVLKTYINERGDEAKDISVDKVGIHAIKQMMTPKGLTKPEEIVHEFGKLMEDVSSQTSLKYPAMVYPESLLAHPKSKILDSLKIAIQHSNDQEMTNHLNYAIVFLDSFIPDKEANKRNNEMLNNEDFMKALKARKTKL